MNDNAELHIQRNVYDITTYKFGVGFCCNTNKPFYFDKEDYKKIKGYQWFEGRNGVIKTIDNIVLDRFIFGAKKVVHKNGDTFDNRKVNLKCA